MIDALRLSRPEREILGAPNWRSVTPWIIAAMTFAIVLVAAAGLVIAHSGRTLERAIESRYTLVVPPGGGEPVAIARRLRGIAGVTAIEPVSEEEMRRTLERWLGPAADSRELPVPAMIDFDLAATADPAAARAAIAKIAPDAQLSTHGESVGPLLQALSVLQWVALALVAMLAAAAASAVVLAARAALDSHRPTLEILHGIGATDAQTSRLFVRRIAFDTFAGSIAGALAAGLVILALASTARWASDMGGIALGTSDLLLLAAIPLLLTAVATLAARIAILSALGREL